jgi:MFS family permease
VQGIGAALMNPATLSIISATFPPKERGAALGIWAGVSAMALAIGPLVGGLITEHINWNWIFFINVPVGAAAIVASRLFIRESKDTSHVQRLDLPGLLTSAAGLVALSYALSEGNRVGGGSARILAIDPGAGTVTRAGRLPAALADPAAVAANGSVYVLGGGTNAVYELR